MRRLAFTFLLIAGATACGSPTSPAQCAYAVSPSAQAVPIGGGTFTAAVSASSTGCSWTAAPDVSWIGVTSGSSGSTSGQLSYTVPASADVARVGAIVVRWSTGSASVSVSQDGVTQCIYTLSPASQAAPASGGTFNFTATRNTPNGCSYAATTSTPWITITGGATGLSGDKVTYGVAANTASASRSGTIAVGWSGGSATFTVTQPGVAGLR